MIRYSGPRNRPATNSADRGPQTDHTVHSASFVVWARNPAKPLIAPLQITRTSDPFKVRARPSLGASGNPSQMTAYGPDRA